MNIRLSDLKYIYLYKIIVVNTSVTQNTYIFTTNAFNAPIQSPISLNYNNDYISMYYVYRNPRKSFTLTNSNYYKL